MNLSMKWLSDFVEITEEPKEYAHKMTMTGSKVEGWEVEGEAIQNVVAGRVLSVDKHPNADSLFICQVDVGGNSPLQIVTGADNVVAGAMVPVALDGSVVAGGKKIRKGKLRGQVSDGMLCSLSELGLTGHDFPYADEDGIFLLEEECEIGQDIRPAIGLNDTVMEFEITSNRPDCLSVIGLARESAVTMNKPLKLPAPVVKGSHGDISGYLSVAVENPRLCPRYVARIAANVKIKPSPRWMRERLRASGVRPINNIVDITNYVMLEYGQPMHAFDLRTVNGGRIIVRNAGEGEEITTLDGVRRSLSPEMLVIADRAAPSAVAGVMGGEFSGISDDTSTIVFESACFFGPSVRSTARKLGMRTESSSRFEKGLDPQNCLPAVQRACELVELLEAGDVVGGVIDCDNSDKTPLRLALEADWINRFLDTAIPAGRMKEILRSLDFAIEGDMVIPPSYRADIETKADVAEEVARIYGYNNIPSTDLRGSSQGSLTPRQKFERAAGQVLLGQGLSEIITYSFISPKQYDRIGLPAGHTLRNSVTISNPLGEDTSVMRTTAIPSMLDTLSRNYNNRNPEAHLFEIATEYLPLPGQELPDERRQIVIGLYGAGCDFYFLKGIVEELLEKLNVEETEYSPCADDPTFHPGRCAVVTARGRQVGVLGEIHPQVCDNFELDTRTYVAKLDISGLYDNLAAEKQYRPLPRFPVSTRDLALVADEDLPVARIQKAIQGAAGPILEKLEIFDVYRGKQIPDGKKSVAFNLTLRAEDRTLTDEECEAAVKRVLKALEPVGVSLRTCIS